jgi:hypothetical protein
LAKLVDHSELRVLSFVLDFLIETVQGPCHHTQHIISQSGLLASVARLLATNLDAAGEVSQLRAGEAQGIVLPTPLEPDTSNPDLLVPEYGQTYERQYYGYTAKQVKASSIVLLLGLIEGRNDTVIHKSITQALDVEVVRDYLSSTYRVQLQIQGRQRLFDGGSLRSIQYQLMNCEDSENWFEEFQSDAYR